MQPPAGVPEGSVSAIHAYRGDGRVITCWRPTPEELVKINLGEGVWLSIWGEGMPPVLVSADSPWIECTPERLAELKTNPPAAGCVNCVWFREETSACERWRRPTAFFYHCAEHEFADPSTHHQPFAG